MGTGNRLIEEWERGWKWSDKLICLRCIGDDFLRKVVARAIDDQQECSFCGEAPAAEFDEFMEAFMVGVRHSFEQVDDAGMPWDGGYVFTTYEHYELPDLFSWVAGGDDEEAVREELRDRLVEKTYASRWWAELEPDEAFSTAWKDFREQILHRTRFVFWARKDPDEHYLGAGDISVAKVLEAIGRLLVEFDLITTLPARTVTYRARGHAQPEDSRTWGARQLGTNLPKNATSSSRMSPAGIPLFYGADDTETALAEVARADDREFFTVGKFVTTEPMTVINLMQVPSVPSIFDPVLGGAQGKLRFLNELVDELRQPIDTARSQSGLRAHAGVLRILPARVRPRPGCRGRRQGQGARPPVDVSRSSRWRRMRGTGCPAGGLRRPRRRYRGSTAAPPGPGERHRAPTPDRRVPPSVGPDSRYACTARSDGSASAVAEQTVAPTVPAVDPAPTSAPCQTVRATGAMTPRTCGRLRLPPVRRNV